MATRFLNFTANQTLPAASLNTNFQETEDSFLDVGPFVVSGLTLSAGTGLSCAVASGVALLGGRLTFAGGAASGLAASSTNHIFLNLDGTLSSNTTGTPPANSLKLGTATTNATVVTSVNMLGASGRQEKQTQLAPYAGTTELRSVLIARRVIDSTGALPLNLNGGQLDAGSLAFAGTLGGSGTPVTLKRFSLTFPSDGDYTLGTGEKDAFYIDVQTGVITTTRNIIVPGAAGGTYCVINRNGQSVTLKTSGGTGITVASTRAAILCTPGGTNMFRITPDTNYTV